jgi:branched-chain amino acid transport system permease protein
MPLGNSRGELLTITLAWAGIILVLLSGWLFVHNDFILRLMMLGAVDMIVVIPFGLLMGHMGYLAMGQASFVGLGAYIVGNLTVLRFEENYWLALLAAVLITGATGYLLSFPLFRLRGYHFAIGTLGLGQLAYLVFNSWTWFSGGTFGVSGVPAPAIGEFEFNTNSRFYLLACVFLLLAAFSSWWVARGSVGLALRAIRQDEDLAAARGLDVLRYKRMVFVFASVFAGLAGGLYAPMAISFDPSSFTVWSSFEYVIYVIIGGAGTLFGPAVGVMFVTILEQAIQGFGEWNQIVFGLLVVFVVLFFRGGLWGAVRLVARTLADRLTRGRALPLGMPPVEKRGAGQ